MDSSEEHHFNAREPRSEALLVSFHESVPTCRASYISLRCWDSTPTSGYLIRSIETTVASQAHSPLEPAADLALRVGSDGRLGGVHNHLEADIVFYQATRATIQWNSISTTSWKEHEPIGRMKC